MFAPPLTALFCIVAAKLMVMTDPAFCFVAFNAMLALYWICIAVRNAGVRTGAAIAVMTLVSYPWLMMVERGNIYAGITAVALLHALFLGLRGRAPSVVALLLAVSVNIRPNAIVFFMPLLILYRADLFRFTISFGLLAPAVFGGSLIATHALYPAYTITSFSHGLAIYYQDYVVHEAGLAGGSSLFGVLKLAIGYRSGLDLVAAIPSGIIMAAALLLGFTRQLSPATFVFLTASAYCLGSSVIADYHLIIFAAPIAARAIIVDGMTPPVSDRISLVGSLLLLIPKNYAFANQVSLQILLNPVILVITCSLILAINLKALTRAVRTPNLIIGRVQAST
jgi:hypothetical protein